MKLVVGLLVLAGAGFVRAEDKPGYRMPMLTPPAEVLPGAALRSHLSGGLDGANLPQALSREVAATFPYSMVGPVVFRSGRDQYSGSATLIKPTVALTAAHNLYDAEFGFSTDLNFSLGQYQGSASRRARAKAIYLYTQTYVDEADRSPDTNRAFAADTGWVTFSQPLAGKESAPYTSRIAALTGGQEKVAVGYGLDFHNGRLPLAVEPTRGFFRKKGAYFENATYGTEGGMSGGPVFGFYRGRLVQLGVVVSGFNDYSQSGIRAIDRGLVRKLRSVK